MQNSRHTVRKKYVFKALVLCAALNLFAEHAFAQDYPTRPVRMLIGFAAGGPTDVQGRIVAEALQPRLGQPIAVENRGGAGGNLAADAVAKAPPDGYTLLFSSNALSISPGIYEKLPFDVLKDFAPITEVVAAPLLLVVHSTVPATTVAELIGLAKARPGQLNYASSGTGTITHLAAAMFASDAGIQVQHVPYKGGAPATTDLIAGRVDFMMAPIGSVRQFVDSGQLRSIAVTSTSRIESLPDVPTVAEAGLPNFEASAWSGLFAPAATPKQIVDRIQKETSGLLQQPDVIAKLKLQEAVPRGTGPKSFGQYIAVDIERWVRIAKQTGAKAE
jgi:tripartite-type tricarboxylate transporter receptor subunit TctC